MDAKYLGVTLSNDLEWSKHIATKTKKYNSKLSFLRRNLKGCPEKLKQTAYFSLIRSFMEYGATVWDPYQKYSSDKIESVSDMLDVLEWTPLSQRRQEARLILFYKIINGLAQVPFEGVRLAIQLAIMDSLCILKLLVYGMGLLSLKLRHWLYLDQILLQISVHPFRIIP